MKEVLDIIALYCMTDDTGALCDQFQTTRFADSSCTIISVIAKREIFCMAGYEKSGTSVKIDLHFVRKIFQKSLLAHFGGLSASQSPFRHSKRKSCTEDNVLTVGKRGGFLFFTVSSLPSHNNLNYELLSLTAICGEVPCACSARLTASESYRKKVVTSLTHDKLLTYLFQSPSSRLSARCPR